jgi:hypothetical protein
MRKRRSSDLRSSQAMDPSLLHLSGGREGEKMVIRSPFEDIELAEGSLTAHVFANTETCRRTAASPSAA